MLLLRYPTLRSGVPFFRASVQAMTSAATSVQGVVVMVAAESKRRPYRGLKLNVRHAGVQPAHRYG